jgi:putative ABC transport system ATP-binding protein
MTGADGGEALPGKGPGRPVLEVIGLTKTHSRGSEEVLALKGAAFELVAGEVVALVGRSGSGKTTLLNLLAGWEEPDDGRMIWLGRRELSRPSLLPWSDLAVVPQSLGLLDDLSVRENVELPERLSRATRIRPSLPVPDGAGPNAGDWLDALGLTDLADRMPDEISIGEQQRTALARALAAAPRLLLADEPSGHQDAVWAAGVFHSLRRAASEGMACLVATHNHEFLGFTDRILSISNGVLEGPGRQ